MVEETRRLMGNGIVITVATEAMPTEAVDLKHLTVVSQKRVRQLREQLREVESSTLDQVQTQRTIFWDEESLTLRDKVTPRTWHTRWQVARQTEHRKHGTAFA